MHGGVVILVRVLQVRHGLGLGLLVGVCIGYVRWYWFLTDLLEI
jgi:hypothetical protein